eukprot:754994-Hanusia_phi.AAC.13
MRKREREVLENTWCFIADHLTSLVRTSLRRIELQSILSENACIGVAAGVAMGMVEGLQKGQNLPNSRLKLNAVVNACSKRAPVFGSNLGVLALMFTTSERITRCAYRAAQTHSQLRCPSLRVTAGV